MIGFFLIESMNQWIDLCKLRNLWTQSLHFAYNLSRGGQLRDGYDQGF